MNAPCASLTLLPSLLNSSAASGETGHTSETVEMHLSNHLPELRRRARVLTRDPHRADDLVQDTLERALRFKHTFREGGHLRAWLMRIMHNVFISQRRRSTTERRVLEGAGLDPNGWATLVPALLTPGLSPPVSRALDEIPDQLRKVVELVDLQDHSYKDAAEVTSVPLGTVMSRLHRGRARLAEALGKVAA
jgi:RNA polymerase sigma-70 factor, ECF subfamily